LGQALAREDGWTDGSLTEMDKGTDDKSGNKCYSYQIAPNDELTRDIE